MKFKLGSSGGWDDISKALEREAIQQATEQRRKELEQIYCPVHGQFIQAIPQNKSRGVVAFTIEGCCDQIVQEARLLMGDHGESVMQEGAKLMNRAVRRFVLAELAPHEEEMLGKFLLDKIPSELQVTAVDLKDTCRLMAEENLLYMDEHPAIPEEYVIKLEARGREAFRNRDEDIPLWSDILWLLRAHQREEIKLAQNVRIGKPVQVLHSVLAESKPNLIQLALKDMINKSFIKALVVNGGEILFPEITPVGKSFLIQAQQTQGVVPVTNIDQSIKIDANGSIVNVHSTLSSCVQKVEGSRLSGKDGIIEALQKLEEALKKAPPETVEDVDSVQDYAKSLVKEATKSQPAEKLVKISADGLKEAATTLAVVVPTVLPAAMELTQQVLRSLGLS